MIAAKVAVLGAGAVGVACALYLQREGHDVLLIDRDEPARGCSFGNAGLIQCSSVVPIAMAGPVSVGKNSPRLVRSSPPKAAAARGAGRFRRI